MSAANAEPLVGVINAGSSSVKFSFYEGERRILDRAGRRDRRTSFGERHRAKWRKARASGSGRKAAGCAERGIAGDHCLGRGKKLGDRRLARARPPCRPWRHALFAARPHVTPVLLAELEALVPLAPLHEPYNLAPIKMAMRLNPELPQVACFDTAFHRTAPEVDQAFALPYSFFEEGIRRYGFHGLSYEYIASVLPERAPEIANGRVVVAHLGNGCSACAMRNRRSIATTMGFTALDGLPMGTRCGELDAGVVLYLIQQKADVAGRAGRPPLSRSGMLGLSGISSDFRELLTSDSPRARFAVEVFCYRVARHIASLAAALGGLDGIVFTAGVGENAAPVRGSDLPGLLLGSGWSWTKRPTGNTRSASAAATAASPLMCMKTDENIMIARHARALAAKLESEENHVRKSRHDETGSRRDFFRWGYQAPDGRARGGQGR